MANPQKENGYTAIANEIMEAFARIRINGEARQVLDFILRKTYGFNKKKDAIALSQFVLGTGLRKNAVCRAIKKLKDLNIIHQKENDIAKIYLFNKDFSTWSPFPKKRKVSKLRMIIPQKENLVVSKKGTTKVDITKVDITKVDLQLATLLKVKIKENLPTFKEPNLESWARHINKMMRLDHRTEEQISYVIKWCQQDNFWQANILSTRKLRDKFDQLVAQIKRNKQKQESNQITII